MNGDTNKNKIPLLPVRTHWDAVVHCKVDEPLVAQSTHDEEAVDTGSFSSAYGPSVSKPKRESIDAGSPAFLQESLRTLESQIAGLNAALQRSIQNDDLSKQQITTEALRRMVDSAVAASAQAGSAVRFAQTTQPDKKGLMQSAIPLATLAALMAVLVLQFVQWSGTQAGQIAGAQKQSSDAFNAVAGTGDATLPSAAKWVASANSKRIGDDVEWLIEFIHHFPNDFRRLNSDQPFVELQTASKLIRKQLIEQFASKTVQE